MITSTILTEPRQPDPLRLAMVAADEIRQHLRDYADATDRPAWEAVQAADLLDTVAELLALVVQP